MVVYLEKISYRTPQSLSVPLFLRISSSFQAYSLSDAESSCPTEEGIDHGGRREGGPLASNEYLLACLMVLGNMSLSCRSALW